MTTTIIPPAPDTVTELEVPEGEPDVLRVGPLALKRHAECDCFWLNAAKGEGWTGDASAFMQEGEWFIELECYQKLGSVRTTGRGSTAEDALAMASRPVFPLGFFSALGEIT